MSKSSRLAQGVNFVFTLGLGVVQFSVGCLLLFPAAILLWVGWVMASGTITAAIEIFGR